MGGSDICSCNAKLQNSPITRIHIEPRNLALGSPNEGDCWPLSDDQQLLRFSESSDASRHVSELQALVVTITQFIWLSRVMEHVKRCAFPVHSTWIRKCRLYFLHPLQNLFVVIWSKFLFVTHLFIFFFKKKINIFIFYFFLFEKKNKIKK